LAHPLLAKEGDWYGIHDFIVKYSLNEKFALYNRYELITKDNMSDSYFALADLGLAYKFHANWTASAYYRYCWIEVADEWEGEHRPLLELNYGVKLKDIALSNRSRLEFRIYDFDRENDVRYRNRTRADLPWGLYGIKPYFEEEFFYSDNANNINANWLTGGLYYKWSHAKLRVGYRWWAQKLSDGSWENRNMLNTNLMFFF